MKIELEVRNFDELNQALAEGVDRIMFDNFTPEDTRKAVEIVGGRCETESSGGITYDTMLPYAQVWKCLAAAWKSVKKPQLQVQTQSSCDISHLM